LSPELVERAADLLTTRTGYRLDPTARERLGGALHEVAAARGRSVEVLVAGLARDPDALHDLVERLTIQESWFFREPAQFEALVERVLPDVGGPGTVWSAGCAFGQEAWSLAMALLEAGRGDLRVLASDVSARALGRASAGRYAERELRGLSQARRARFTTAGPEGVAVGQALRNRVSFVRHNLATDPPPLATGSCQIVFCRNVLIYLRPEGRQAALAHIARLLPAGGWLFLGFAESLWQVTDAFEVVRLGEVFTYRRVAGAEAVRRPAAPRRERGAATARPAPPAPPDDDPVALARREVFERPDDPFAYAQLGLLLEAAGDRAAARRAFSAARSALGRSYPAPVEAALKGWRPAELATLLDEKLARGLP
jgi:chemotaxis methyl-accepting protein methylase